MIYERVETIYDIPRIKYDRLVNAMMSICPSDITITLDQKRESGWLFFGSIDLVIYFRSSNSELVDIFAERSIRVFRDGF